jgi:hypothetical protein
MELEIKQQARKGEYGSVSITPPIDESYWLYRVHLFKDQYILAFPKFWVIGIGFSQEEDWNTNLPSSCPAEQIADHIWHNHKYNEITREQVIQAITLIQDYIKSTDNKIKLRHN